MRSPTGRRRPPSPACSATRSPPTSSPTTTPAHACAADFQLDTRTQVSIAYRNGGRGLVTPAVGELTGQPPRPLERFIADHRDAFG